MILRDEARLKKEWWQLDPKLRVILSDADWFLSKHSHELILTCLIRSDAEQADLFEHGLAPAMTSVHCVGRGGDARPTSDETINQALESYINDKYIYDANRPNLKTCLREKTDGTADHWHFQCWVTT